MSLLNGIENVFVGDAPRTPSGLDSPRALSYTVECGRSRGLLRVPRYESLRGPLLVRVVRTQS